MRRKQNPNMHCYKGVSMMMAAILMGCLSGCATAPSDPPRTEEAAQGIESEQAEALAEESGAGETLEITFDGSTEEGTEDLENVSYADEEQDLQEEKTVPTDSSYGLDPDAAIRRLCGAYQVPPAKSGMYEGVTLQIQIYTAFNNLYMDVQECMDEGDGEPSVYSYYTRELLSQDPYYLTYDLGDSFEDTVRLTSYSNMSLGGTYWDDGELYQMFYQEDHNIYFEGMGYGAMDPRTGRGQNLEIPESLARLTLEYQGETEPVNEILGEARVDGFAHKELVGRWMFETEDQKAYLWFNEQGDFEALTKQKGEPARLLRGVVTGNDPLRLACIANDSYHMPWEITPLFASRGMNELVYKGAEGGLDDLPEGTVFQRIKEEDIHPFMSVDTYNP